MKKTAELSGAGNGYSGFARFRSSLKYCFYAIFHPVDGFWDLTHEKRGSTGAATFILVMALLTRVWRLQYTNFQFIRVNWERINIFMQVMGILMPFLIWVLSNWALTTLFDGKGNLRNVYIASCYAIAPYPIVMIPNTIFSNILAADESTFYVFFYYLSLAWCVILMVVGMSQIHEYKMGKNLICILFSIVGMAVIIFILLLFFSLISDGIAYFYSLYKEIIFRLY